MTKIAVIRIAGKHGHRQDTKKTMDMLRIKKKFSCRILEDNPVNKGMVKSVKDQVTWGELDKEMEAKFKDSDVIFLHPPIGGMRPTKKPYKLGGALGYRGEKINDLLKRMLG
ncbi:MAG: uL30 family ribosomal protein [Nanoarchaeota archaeon]|nr:uL30 family ribosomal protein [Nanoarchaeota archaeon]